MICKTICNSNHKKNVFITPRILETDKPKNPGHKNGQQRYESTIEIRKGKQKWAP